MKVNQKCHIHRSLQDKDKHQQLNPVKVPFNPLLVMNQPLPDGAALLHHLRSVEARQFAESVIAVDDGPLHDLSVAYEEAGLWGTGDRWPQSLDQNLGPPGLSAQYISFRSSEDARSRSGLRGPSAAASEVRPVTAATLKTPTFGSKVARLNHAAAFLVQLRGKSGSAVTFLGLNWLNWLEDKSPGFTFCFIFPHFRPFAATAITGHQMSWKREAAAHRATFEIKAASETLSLNHGDLSALRLPAKKLLTWFFWPKVKSCLGFFDDFSALILCSSDT